MLVKMELKLFIEKYRLSESPTMEVKQLKRILYLFLILFVGITGACSQEHSSNETSEGIIVEKVERQDRWNQILVVPNISKDDISNKTTVELIEMAQENDGAFYSLEPGEYEKLEVGTNVIVYWNGDQEDSDPPQREAKKIDVVSK